jgi:hypothetical protein
MRPVPRWAPSQNQPCFERPQEQRWCTPAGSTKASGPASAPAPGPASELLDAIGVFTPEADILFILILVELFRLLIIYLQEQRVSIGVSVEIAIVSVLREVIVNGVLETEWQQILAVCLFLATAALLLVVRVWLPPTFEGVDPEARMSARIRLRKPGE